MTGQFASGGSAPVARRERRAAVLARQIEHDLCQRHWPVGVIFASQQELSQRYRVGEDCLRDAIRILEFNGVGRMRPGPGGGLLIGRPSINLPVASVVGYFRVVWEPDDGATHRAILAARSTVAAVAARLCCERIDREDDAAFPGQFTASPNTNPSDALITALADLAADSLLQLASCCLVTLSHLFRGPRGASSTNQSLDNPEILSGLSESIITGDETSAAVQAKRLVDLLEDWDGGRGKQMSDPFMAEGSPLNRSRVGQLVRTIVTEINTGAFGEEKLLGSEAVLADRYAAALGTVRQALAVLEDAGVVAVRRGRSNGWFACSPSLELPLRQVRNYLASCQVDPGHARRLIEMIRGEAGDGSRNAILDLLVRALEGYATLFGGSDEDMLHHQRLRH